MNTFVIPFDFMTIRLQDVATILGLPIVGDEIPSLFDQLFKDLGCSFDRPTKSSFSFMMKTLKKHHHILSYTYPFEVSFSSLENLMKKIKFILTS